MRLPHMLAAALALAPLPALAQGHGSASDTASHMHRGLNILGYDKDWTDPGKAKFHDSYYRIVRQGGFDFVRVVLMSFDHMDANNRLDPVWLKALDHAVHEATAAGLDVIIDEHDFDRCAADASDCKRKLVAFWQQVAPLFARAPASVQFELLNEPHDQLDGEVWNQLLAKLIPIVRATNPTRVLMIGPTHWNSLNDLPLLKLPTDDRNIIVEVHYYEPFHFTHQGASWAHLTDLKGVPFTDADAVRIRRDFDRIAAWSHDNNRPVLLGGFGAYNGSGTPVAERARWTATVREAAESHGLPWAYWYFDGGFGVYDPGAGQWITPIHQALIPGEK